MVTKLNKVLEKIKEVMTWLEQADSESLHLLHLANIKQCSERNEVISSDKLHIMNIFVRRKKCK
jgi:hypothetical protein